MKPDSPTISIIIPVLNEGATIGALLGYLYEHTNPALIREILVVDGGSTDDTRSIAGTMGVRVIRSGRGRAVQMNKGAMLARAEVLYFLHADTYPPPGFDRAILDAVSRGHGAGSFRMRFDCNSRFLSFFAWCSRFNSNICRGGDQSLFVLKTLFRSSGGFNEAYRIYEDNEFTARLYRTTRFTVLPQSVTTSARKYRQLNRFRLQLHFGMIHLKRYCGAGPDSLYRYYSRNITA